VVTEFSTGITPNASLTGITAGPDGNIWFTELGANRIGRLTVGGSGAPTSISQIPLSSGWNLISLPVQPADTTITSVLLGIAGSYQVVWGYTNQSWKLYDPNDPDGSTLTTMAAGNGYWINMTAAGTLSLSGSTPSSSVSLLAGWNLVGYSGTSCGTATSVLSSIASTVQVSWGYAGQAWKVYDPKDPAGSTLTQLCPNNGYWIKVNQAGTWTAP
jgi:hypothetical protein